MRDSMVDKPNPEDELTEQEIELLQMRAARYAASSAEASTDIAEGVVFRRGESHWAVPLGALREVRPLRGFRKIPGASAAVPGILHFRGEILSLHDVGAFMHPEAESADAAWVIVIEYGGERIGLAADEIVDIDRYSRSNMHPLPITLGERAAICEGLLPGGVVLLSPARLFDTEAFFSAF